MVKLISNILRPGQVATPRVELLNPTLPGNIRKGFEWLTMTNDQAVSDWQWKTIQITTGTELITPVKGDIVCTQWQHLGRKSFI